MMKPIDATWFTSPARFCETSVGSVTSFALPVTDALHRHSADEAAQLDPGQVLVGMLLPIGDTLFATPALAALRNRFPLAKISVLAARSNAGILEDNPNVDHLLIVDEPGSEHKMVRFARGLSELRSARYDLVINFSAVGSIVLRMAGIYRRPLQVDMPLLWWLVGGHSESYRARHATEHYLGALAPILDHELSEEERQPRIYLTARDRSQARKLLREWGLSPANLLIVMHVGGEGFNGRKRWAPQRFAAVARQLIERFGAHVLLVGGKDDEALCQTVAALLPAQRVRIAAGRTTLKQTGALIELSALFIGNDSCPLHIAAAVGTPAVGIYGPSNYEQFRPVGRRHYRQRVVHSDLPCSPCFHFVGNDAPWVPNTCYSFACLKAIAPEQVLEAALDLLQDPREEQAGG
jgi:lipopolysaccharide heptosyltransferase II